MDLQLIDIILKILQIAVVPLLILIIKLFMDQRKELGTQKDRITKIEECLKAVPNETALHELALTIREFGGDLKVAVEKIGGVGRIVDRLERMVNRHEEHLLNNGGK